MRPNFAVWGCMALVAAVSCIGGCKRGGEASGGADGGAGQQTGRGGGRRGGGAGVAFAVETMTVVPEQVAYIVRAPGTIEAFERVQVTSRVSGVVDRVAFSEGAEVKKGDVLVVVDSERYQLVVNMAKVTLDKANAQLADAEAALARREGAAREHPGIIQGEELETYRTKVRLARIEVAQQHETLKQAYVNLRDSAVRAPIDGVIQSRSVETGQLVQPGLLLGTLLRRDPLLLRFHVTTMEAPRLRPGMTATFQLRETQRVFSAKIVLVAAAADTKTHQVAVTAEVTTMDNPYWLRPGSYCDVSIVVSAGRAAPVIPQTAVRPNEKGFLAYVVEGDVARERLLSLGMYTPDGRVEIREGLRAKDRLVIRGAEALSDGARVSVVESPAGRSSAPESMPSGLVENPPPSTFGPAHPVPSGLRDGGARTRRNAP